MPRLSNEEIMPDFLSDIDTDQRASSPYLMRSPVLSPTIPSSTYRFASLINSSFSPIYSAVGALAPSAMERGDALEDDTERPLQPKKAKKAKKASPVSAEPRTSTRLRLATLQKKEPKPISRKPSSSAKRELRPQREVEKGAVGKRGRPAKTATTPRKKRAARGDESTQVTKAGRKEWEVEQIVDSRIDTETMQHWFKVKWKGYPSKDNTWEPKKNLTNCKTLLENYEKKGKK
ncbi:hypothetical protein MKX08_008621 [Trichoderma sp. CBMAI-0020]|nr:hypothetical protein MKX08_008621 [Trichoderma sp. CBMAI-0020]